MSRYIGPRLKKARALGRDLPGLTRKPSDRRPYRPGQHGQARRRKVSDYALRLAEKQALRFNYGLNERQLRNLMAEALRGVENSGEKLLRLLEARLDNVVFRAGFAPTIPAARQLVTHGHIMVNGRRCTFPSYRVVPGEAIGPVRKAWQHPVVVDALLFKGPHRPTWLKFDEETLTATMSEAPDPAHVPFPLDVRLVVEYYAASL